MDIANATQANGRSQEAETELTSMGLSKVVGRLMRLRPALTERAGRATTMRELAYVGGYPNISAMLSDLDARDGLPNSPSSNSLPKKGAIKNGDSELTEANHEMLEWNRTRIRRFRPDVSAAIAGCISKAQLAAACGYDDPSKLFSTLGEWEKENGFQEMIRQQKLTLEAAVTKARQKRDQNIGKELRNANEVKEQVPTPLTKKQRKKAKNEKKYGKK